MEQLEKLKSTPEGLALIEGQKLSKDQKIEKSLKKIKTQISKAQTAMNMPVKGTIGPFNIFVTEQTKGVAGITVTEIMKVAAQKYKNLSESEKETLKAKADEANQKRKSEYDTWASKLAGTEEMNNLEELRAKQENLQAKLKDAKKPEKKKAEKGAKKTEKELKKKSVKL